jgi:hypothetical protein
MRAHLNTLIVSAAILLTAVILSNAFIQRNKATKNISVTGLGKKDFVADLIVWSGSFTQKNMSLKEAYANLDRDREHIQKYLLSKGLRSENIIFSAVEINKLFDDVYDGSGRKVKSVFEGYSLKQTVQIESNEVDKIENLSRQVSELINSGVEFYSEKPEYFYTKLGQLKIEMIAEATKDAATRAQKIAENAGGKVGSLKSANQGIFQIVAQNSNEDYSWGGSFNTSSKKKTATITMKLEYEID